MSYVVKIAELDSVDAVIFGGKYNSVHRIYSSEPVMLNSPKNKLHFWEAQGPKSHPMNSGLHGTNQGRFDLCLTSS